VGNSIITERKRAAKSAEPQSAGVDSTPAPVVQSGFSIFNNPEGTAMTKPEDTQAQAAAKTQADAAKAEKLAAAKAEREKKAAEAQAAKEAKKAEAEVAKKAKAAEAAAKAEKAAAEKAEREQAAAARAEELKAKGLSYTGSMLALRDAKDHYVKGPNGRLHSGDPVATAFAALLPAGVIAVCLKLLEMAINKYAALNVGQQSMNLRNLVRGALKNGKLNQEAILAAIAEVDPALTVAGAKQARAAEVKARTDELAAKRAEKAAADEAAKKAKAAEREARKAEKAEKEPEAA